MIFALQKLLRFQQESESGREDLNPSIAPSIGRIACKNTDEATLTSDGSRVLASDSPGCPGFAPERVRAAVTDALAAMSAGRLDLARQGLEALLRSLSDEERAQ